MIFLVLSFSKKHNFSSRQRKHCNGSTDTSDGLLAKGDVESFRKHCATVCVCVSMSSWDRMPLNPSMLYEL